MGGKAGVIMGFDNRPSIHYAHEARQAGGHWRMPSEAPILEACGKRRLQ
jgi:hypothetical protein